MTASKLAGIILLFALMFLGMAAYIYKSIMCTIRGNRWYDHAAEQGGGPISFVQQFYNLSYPCQSFRYSVTNDSRSMGASKT